MKKLIWLAILVALAVVLTLAANENTGKVAIFLTTHRIDFSLNFAIVALVVAVFVVWFTLGALRASSKVPAKLKRFMEDRRQKALLQANTTGLIALINGDDILADKALKNARKTGVENELSYLIRALSALQSDRFDVADDILEQGTSGEGDYQEAIAVLKGKVALSKHNYRLALTIVQDLPAKCAKYPQVLNIKLLALIGVQDWSNALTLYRQMEGMLSVSKTELNSILDNIYGGLTEKLANKSDELTILADQATNAERVNPVVLKHLSAALLNVGQAERSRKMLEAALERNLETDLLSVYEKVAGVQSQQCLPFVEQLLAKHPQHIALLEIAAGVCEREQLWGKAISRFESVYQRKASAPVAGKLERLYELANQPEKAAFWHKKLQEHLGITRQLN